MPKRNILEVIHSLTEDKIFPPSHNLAQIAQITKGIAPVLTEILQDYIGQNADRTGSYRIRRLQAAKRMLGAV